MRAYHLDTEHTEAKSDNRETEAMRVESRRASVATPGRPMSFQEALDSSMTKFDVALHRLAK